MLDLPVAQFDAQVTAGLAARILVGCSLCGSHDLSVVATIPFTHGMYMGPWPPPAAGYVRCFLFVLCEDCLHRPGHQEQLAKQAWLLLHASLN